MSSETPASKNVGTRLLFENDRVRVWEMRLAPGESTDRHLHDSDYLFVNLKAAHVTLYPEQGEPISSEARPGGVEYTEVGQGIVHRLQNTGDSEHWEILVELKGPSRSPTPREPQTND
jgi:beta-alanine degradation protein BauB